MPDVPDVPYKVCYKAQLVVVPYNKLYLSHTQSHNMSVACLCLSCEQGADVAALFPGLVKTAVQT